MITTVTMTGADDSIRPSDLVELKNDFYFAEFAILFSTKRTGTPRYPSAEWISELFSLSDNISLSAHLCGDYAKNMLLGNDDFLQLAGSHFNRIQINHNFNYNPVDFIIEKWPEKDFILQWNKSNEMVCKSMTLENYSNLHFLYDASGGMGTKSEILGNPIKRHYTGYAGGISPDNIVEICYKVNQKTPNDNVWIDMETHIRSNNDQLFDLKKVTDCLIKSEQFIADTNA